MELSREELLAIDGGVSGWVITGIIAGIVFLIGVVDGYVRPIKCN